MGVVSDEEHLGLLRWPRLGGERAGRLIRLPPGYRASGRVEVRPAVVDIGFEVGAFSPFVPGVDEHHRLAEHRVLLRSVNGAGKPALVERGSGSVDDGPRALPAGLVVPG